jgi:hypothetical protein
MANNTVADRKGKKLTANTAEAGGAAYAPHDQQAEKLAGKARKEPSDDAGDERTPEKTIGEIKYMEQK